MNTKTFLGDKAINRMGFGAMQLAGPGVFGPPRDPSAARGVLRRAIELGVDHIDTEGRHDTAVPLEEQLFALEDMRQEGKLDLIGLSNVDQAKVRLALQFVDVGEIQN